MIKSIIKSIISRTYLPSETKGSFYAFDGEKLLYRCKCIELPWNNNERNASCIPEGTYEVVKYVSEKRGNTFLLKDVPGRSDILIHKGNFKRDTLGCILPGIYFIDIDSDEIPDVGESTKALENLYDVLPDKFSLTIM